MRNAPEKARHALVLMHAGAVLAGLASDDIRARALARYCFLYGESALEWLSRWRNQLKRDPASARQAAQAKKAVRALRYELDSAGEIRHYLAAKRQRAAATRADDMEATLLLWQAVNGLNVASICAAARDAYDVLSGGDSDSALSLLAVPAEQQRAIASALGGRDPAFWYLAADTAAELRPYTIPVAQGGELGRRIAQANDVAEHLETLLRVAPVLESLLPYDWLIRSAIVTELSALLDLTLGPPPDGQINVMFPVIELCRALGADETALELERLRSSIGPDGWSYLRFARNTIGAHLDRDLSIFELQRHLVELDYAGVVALAVYVLNSLDGLGAARLELKLLLLGERQIRSWPTDPAKGDLPRPNPRGVPGSLTGLFRKTDSPYMVGSASNRAAGVLAGVSAGRRPLPRPSIKVAQRWRWYLEPLPFQLPEPLR